MARLPLATRMVMRLDVWSVRLTGASFFMWLYARRSGPARDPEFKSRQAPALVLTTRGRRSGRPRAVVLPCFSFDGQTFVVGSKGGASADPDWVRNLRTTPTALIYMNRETCTVVARFADKDERARLWPQLIALAPTYDGYQRGTTREIPLVIIGASEAATPAAGMNHP
jgi:deazaflavin-dependent oxidoreductase (nitroreductase family)